MEKEKINNSKEMERVIKNNTQIVNNAIGGNHVKELVITNFGDNKITCVITFNDISRYVHFSYEQKIHKGEAQGLKLGEIFSFDKSIHPSFMGDISTQEAEQFRDDLNTAIDVIEKLKNVDTSELICMVV